MNMLVLGGCRSGKSSYAARLATENYGRKCLVATLEAGDDQEMRRRIELHRAGRGKGWNLVEEPLAIAEAMAINQKNNEVFVVDCLTMWLTNMVLKGMNDAEIEGMVANLARVLNDISSDILLVANEVGLGIVPEASLGRRFRDLAGWTNQQLAAACDEVVFMAAGLPLYLKQQ